MPALPFNFGLGSGGGVAGGPIYNTTPGRSGPSYTAGSNIPGTAGGLPSFPSYGGAPGLAPGAGSGPYGAVPTVPNPITTAAGAIGGDLGNLGGISSLTGGLAGANAAGAQGAVASGLPGYAGMLGTSSQNIQSDLMGQVSPDVWNQIQQAGAERGVATGSPGGPNANAAMLAALGKTSMGLQAQGQQELTGAVNRTPTGPAVNSAEFAVTPDQMQQAGYAQSVFNAAPNPTLARQADQAALLAQIGAGQGAGGGGGGFQIGGGGPRLGGTDALGFPMAGAYGNDGPSGTDATTAVLSGPQGGANPSTFDYNAWMKTYFPTGGSGGDQSQEGFYPYVGGDAEGVTIPG
jgi:hypothetical protein